MLTCAHLTAMAQRSRAGDVLELQLLLEEAADGLLGRRKAGKVQSEDCDQCWVVGLG